VNELSVAVIPDSVPFEQAVVLPMGISTALAGLQDYLEIPLPSVPPKPTGNAILIWGGSSSVGASAIQLAIGSGLKVISTASKSNLDLVKSLGAEHVFDYKDAGVVENTVKAIKESGGKVVGAFDAIGTEETEKPIAEVLHRLGGGNIASVHLIPEGIYPTNVIGKFGALYWDFGDNFVLLTDLRN
jgi:NADPH:quinone reductase-like Zn-dependent oxidoreductase